MSTIPRIVVIGTGGSIASPGHGPLNLFDYAENGGGPIEVDLLLAMFPGVFDGFDLIPVRFRAIPSPAITPADWLDLIEVVSAAALNSPRADGIVITHGTASMEETAYFLHLTLRIDIPVVLVGSQRPPNGLSTDVPLNLLNAIRVAASPLARDLGVLVVMNDEIHAAREATKAATVHLNAFRSNVLGILGMVDPDGGVCIYRRPVRRHGADTAFNVRGQTALPLVDIAYSYSGADGRVVRHLAQTGTRCIVSAAQPPGWQADGERQAMVEAAANGVVIVISSRGGSGRVLHRAQDFRDGFVAADNLNPQKARVLGMLALTVTEDVDELRQIFREY